MRGEWKYTLIIRSKVAARVVPGQFYPFTLPEANSVFRSVTTDIPLFPFILKVRGELPEKLMHKLRP